MRDKIILALQNAHDLCRLPLTALLYRSVPSESRATIDANVEFSGNEAVYRRMMWRKELRRSTRKPNPTWWAETAWSKWRKHVKASPNTFEIAAKTPDATITKFADKKKATAR